jgi:PBSX family phage terminase large subunit
VDIYLHQKQIDFVMTSEHHAAFVGGIGSGKSYAGCVRGIMAAGGQIGTERIPTPNVGVVTAPTYGMLRDATLRTFLEIAGRAVVDFNKSEMRATIANGSEILFRSTEHYERLRGPSISWWFGDEAALYPREVRRIMLGRLRQHSRYGYNWLATTPRGRDWIYQTFAVKAKPDYRLVRSKTAENPYLDPDFILALQDEYAGEFALQELDGEFIAFEGLVYPEFDVATHTHRGVIDASRFKEVIAGVDWGFVNPGVILVGGVDHDGRITIVHEEYQRKRRIEDWAAIAAELKNVWGINRFACDPSEPDYIKHFRQAGCEASQADNRVIPGIQAVRQRLVVREDGLPRLRLTPSAANLTAEFGQYQWAVNRDGLRDEPRKANDHAMDALRYLVMAADSSASGITLQSEERKYA